MPRATTFGHLILFASVLSIVTAAVGLRPTATQEPQASPKPAETTLCSIAVSVIGESYIGVQYSRSARLKHDDGKWTLVYSCSSLFSSRRCACRELKGELRESVVKQFLEEMKKQASGESAACCDHPYTRIEVKYENGSSEKLVIGHDVLADYEKKEADKPAKVFDLACRLRAE